MVAAPGPDTSGPRLPSGLTFGAAGCPAQGLSVSSLCPTSGMPPAPGPSSCTGWQLLQGRWRREGTFGEWAACPRAEKEEAGRACVSARSPLLPSRGQPPPFLSWGMVNCSGLRSLGPRHRLPRAGVGLCLLHLGPSTAHSRRLGAERAVGGATLPSQEPDRSPHPTPWSCHPVPSVIAEPGRPCNSNHSFPDRPQRTLPPVDSGLPPGDPLLVQPRPPHHPPLRCTRFILGTPVISLLCPLAALPWGCSLRGQTAVAQVWEERCL